MNSKDSGGHKNSRYANPSPYPEVRVLEPNNYYASLLQDDYAGRISEFSAISQYLYHHFYFEYINKNLGGLLENISIVEMRHMELLADAIVQLGGNPQIRGSFSTNGDYWNGKYVYYGNRLIEQLKADLQAEHQAIEAYQAHLRIIQDPYIQALLRRIILDEMLHVRLFNEAIEQYCLG